MFTPTNKPAYVTLHRLGELSGRSRNTLLLRMRDGELLADATLDVGGTPQPLFVAERVAELKRLPSAQGPAGCEPDALNSNPDPAMHNEFLTLTKALNVPLLSEDDIAALNRLQKQWDALEPARTPTCRGAHRRGAAGGIRRRSWTIQMPGLSRSCSSPPTPLSPARATPGCARPAPHYVGGSARRPRRSSNPPWTARSRLCAPSTRAAARLLSR